MWLCTLTGRLRPQQAESSVGLDRLYRQCDELGDVLRLQAAANRQARPSLSTTAAKAAPLPITALGTPSVRMAARALSSLRQRETVPSPSTTAARAAPQQATGRGTPSARTAARAQDSSQPQRPLQSLSRMAARAARQRMMGRGRRSARTAAPARDNSRLQRAAAGRPVTAAPTRGRRSASTAALGLRRRQTRPCRWLKR